MVTRSFKYTRVLFAAGVLLSSGTPIRAQSPLGMVSGRVLSVKTGTPLKDVNVFLANTMLGSATNENGEFTIKSVPAGSYEMVISHVGYLLKKQFIRLNPGQSLWLEFKVPQKIILFPDIEVTARRDKTWKRQLKYFTTTFLGTSRNAAKCKIINPQVLTFQQNKKKHIFSTWAHAQLLIENKALGYRLHYLLEDFEIEHGVVQYMGFPRFEFLEAHSKKQQARWRKNRLKTYYGSQRHFLASFLSRRYGQDGFLVQAIRELPIGDDIVRAYDVAPDSLLTGGNVAFQKRISFSHFLQVTYTRENEAPEYQNWLAKQSGITPNDRTFFVPRAQTSWIKMNHNFAEVDTSGNVAGPFAFTVYGYWGWERVADLLPFEYKPNRK